MRIAAVERHLQKISEAAVRLSDHAEILCPGVPWRNIRGIGNFLRHEYDRGKFGNGLAYRDGSSASTESLGHHCAEDAGTGLNNPAPKRLS
jgi:hypothetical protein